MRVAIGERRKPRIDDRSSFVRVDSVRGHTLRTSCFDVPTKMDGLFAFEVAANVVGSYGQQFAVEF